MTKAKMTLIGMENELNYHGKSITDKFILDNENFDKDVLFSAIVTKGATFEPLYYDPDFFYFMVGNFWSKWERTFLEWFNAFDIEYNPLDNYDRHEEITDNTDDVGAETNTSGRESDNASVNSGSLTSGTDTTTENKYSAMDASDYSPHDKSIVDSDTSETTSSNENGHFEESATGETHNTFNREQTHTAHIWGNIGVVTSSKMLEEYLNVRAWNIYEHIANIFAKELLITIY